MKYLPVPPSLTEGGKDNSGKTHNQINQKLTEYTTREVTAGNPSSAQEAEKKMGKGGAEEENGTRKGNYR